MGNECGDFDANTLKIMPNADQNVKSCTMGFSCLFLYFFFFFLNMKHVDQRVVRTWLFPSADHVLRRYYCPHPSEGRRGP